MKAIPATPATRPIPALTLEAAPVNWARPDEPVAVAVTGAVVMALVPTTVVAP